jgi:hypothetical protein
MYVPISDISRGNHDDTTQNISQTRVEKATGIAVQEIFPSLI